MSDVAALDTKGQSPAGKKADANQIFRHAGMPYVEFMSFAMNTFGTRTYFEIGTRKGMSLAGVNCRSVSVDPEFVISTDVIGSKPVCMFFQIPSDRFFEDFNLTQLLGGPAECSFLDGFHVFEFLLRDFMNTEKHCKKNSLVFLHDCLPRTAQMARRRMRPARVAGQPLAPAGGWAGDVWKVVPILRKYRPDLKIHALDCPPSGLIMITGLDPSNRVLDDNYFEIAAEFKETADDIAQLEAFAKTVELVATRDIQDLADFGKYSW